MGREREGGGREGERDGESEGERSERGGERERERERDGESEGERRERGGGGGEREIEMGVCGREGGGVAQDKRMLEEC